MRHAAAEDPHPYAALAAACGLPGVRGLTGTIVRLRARLGLPASLTEAGVPREAVLEAETDVLEAALADPCASQAPAPLTRDALQALLRQPKSEARGLILSTVHSSKGLEYALLRQVL